MNRRSFIAFVGIVAVLLITFVLLPKRELQKFEKQTSPTETNFVPGSELAAPNAHESGNPTVHTEISPDKKQAIKDILMGQNQRSLDVYGIVVDQNGEPVVGAVVEGSVLLNAAPSTSSGRTYHTQTDTQGRFQFIDVQGVRIGMRPTKEGYYYDPKLPYSRPENYSPHPDNPLVLRMWRLQGEEALVNSVLESQLPVDGTPITLTLVGNNQNPSGELHVSMKRTPGQVRRSGQKFDWKLDIQFVQGGLIATYDPYPFRAPDDGYSSSFRANVSSNDVPWTSTLTQNCFFRNAQGRFGRLRVSLYAALTPARIKLEYWINPSGSQNLEYQAPR